MHKTLFLCLAVITQTCVAMALTFRIVPRNDYGTTPTEEKTHTTSPALNELVDDGKNMDNGIEDFVRRGTPFLDLQGNFEAGGAHDLVFQSDLATHRFEAFVCPSLRQCIDQLEPNNARITSQQRIEPCLQGEDKRRYWRCDQVYSGDTDQVAADYRSSERLRLVMDYIVNNVVITAATAPFPFFSTELPTVISDLIGIKDIYDLSKNVIHAHLDSHNLQAAERLIHPRQVVFLRESKKWDVVKAQSIFRTRNVRGAKRDESWDYHGDENSLLELSYGDRYRPVQMFPESIESTGLVSYQVVGPLSARTMRKCDRDLVCNKLHGPDSVEWRKRHRD